MNVNQCRRVGNIFWLCLCLLWSALRHQPAVELQETCEGDAPGPWTNQLPLLWNHPHKEWEEQACWNLWCYACGLVGINGFFMCNLTSIIELSFGISWVNMSFWVCARLKPWEALNFGYVETCPTGIYPENFVKIVLDLAEIYRILIFLFVFLFVCLFVFYLNRLGILLGTFSESFMRMGLDLAEILRI